MYCIVLSFILLSYFLCYFVYLSSPFSFLGCGNACSPTFNGRTSSSSPNTASLIGAMENKLHFTHTESPDRESTNNMLFAIDHGSTKSAFKSTLSDDVSSCSNNVAALLPSEGNFSNLSYDFISVVN